MRRTLAVTGSAIFGIAAVAAFVVGQSGFAATGYHVLGVPRGGVRCSDMTHNLRTDRERWRPFYTSYTTGFITGANYVVWYSAKGGNANVGFDVPTDVLFASVERYCEQTPQKNIHEAVTTAYSQLAARPSPVP